MSAFTAADCRYIAGACCDDGALVFPHEVEGIADELECRIGEEPTEEQVIDYAVAEYRRRTED